MASAPPQRNPTTRNPDKIRTLETVFSPAASARDRTLASIIRTLATRLADPIAPPRDGELETLLAVSVVLARERRKEPAL